jgi:carbamoyltransferase
MTICGIKLTHDGAVALIDGGRLVFSYEMEKLNNNHRHSPFCLTLRDVDNMLAEHGYRLKEIDQLVIDGWGDWDPAALRSAEAREKYTFCIPVAGESPEYAEISELADYGNLVRANDNILTPKYLKSTGYELAFKSYKHVSGHVLGAYCTSPFAKRSEDAFILVWDGGMPPQLFYYKPRHNQVLNLGHLFIFTGYIYINFAHAFEPFCRYEKHLSLAGKAMAYMALGEVDPRVLAQYRSIFAGLDHTSRQLGIDIDVIAVFTDEFIRQAKHFREANDIRHQDMLATFQVFMEELLIENLRTKLQMHPGLVRNLCFAGGCALNIKWNGGIRESGLFEDVWVPPFPNDSGSAIGVACCEMVTSGPTKALDWNVYCGPALQGGHPGSAAYAACDCSLQELARLLHESNEPVVFLNGAAEAGPRALGNRSILAAPVEPAMKKKLNQIKGREDYRPVAPICLEEEAPDVFEPGTPDPYMLFEHFVRPVWKDKVPAVCHLDGTARLQTVNAQENPVVYQLLCHYKAVSGVPLLCNTSANLSGSGFFPDLQTVMQWGEVNFIWHDGKLYFRNGSVYAEKMLAEKNGDPVS